MSALVRSSSSSCHHCYWHSSPAAAVAVTIDISLHLTSLCSQQQGLPSPLLSAFIGSSSNGCCHQLLLAFVGSSSSCHHHHYWPLSAAAAAAITIVVGLCHWQQQRLPLPLLLAFVAGSSGCRQHYHRPLSPAAAAVAIANTVGLCW